MATRYTFQINVFPCHFTIIKIVYSDKFQVLLPRPPAPPPPPPFSLNRFLAIVPRKVCRNGPNGGRRLGRPSKRLLVEAETGILRPKSWRMMMMMMKIMTMIMIMVMMTNFRLPPRCSWGFRYSAILTRRRLVDGYRPFGSTYRSHLQESASQSKSWSDRHFTHWINLGPRINWKQHAGTTGHNTTSAEITKCMSKDTTF